MPSRKRSLAKQIEDCILQIHSQGYSTMSKDEIKKVSVDDMYVALVHLKLAKRALKID